MSLSPGTSALLPHSHCLSHSRTPWPWATLPPLLHLDSNFLLLEGLLGLATVLVQVGKRNTSLAHEPLGPLPLGRGAARGPATGGETKVSRPDHFALELHSVAAPTLPDGVKVQPAPADPVGIPTERSKGTASYLGIASASGTCSCSPGAGTTPPDRTKEVEVMGGKKEKGRVIPASFPSSPLLQTHPPPKKAEESVCGDLLLASC